MNRKIIRMEDLPADNASWSQLTEFALTFDPIAEIGEWTWSSDLLRFSNSSSVKELRSSLYFIQRAWHDREISVSTLDEMSKVVLLIRSKLLKAMKEQR